MRLLRYRLPTASSIISRHYSSKHYPLAGLCAASSEHNMLALQVNDLANGPEISQVPRCPAPSTPDVKQIRVTAAGIHRIVRIRAAGGHQQLPHIPGIDGTGIDVGSGKAVYFFSPQGTLAEYINVPAASVVELPGNVDPVLAAAVMNPVMSSWMALKGRVDPSVLRQGWSVLINGVTTASGKMAVHVAKALGADKIFGAARSSEKMEMIKGLDARIVLHEDPSLTDFGAAAGATVVLDYLWGPWPAQFLNTTTRLTSKQLTWVGIGQLAGHVTPNGYGIDSVHMRGRDVTIRGAGPGAWALSLFASEMKNMVQILSDVSIEEEIKVKTLNLEQGVEAWVWKDDGQQDRIVVLMGRQPTLHKKQLSS